MNRINRSACGWAVGVLVMCTAWPAGALERTDTGCGQLAAAVEAQVDAAIGRRLFGVDQPRRWSGAVLSSRAACGTTAAVASAAFSRSFERYSQTVQWDIRGTIDPGDWCLSHFLDQCYPNRDPGSVSLLSASFVDEAWQAVRAAILPQMPFGVGSDWVTFRGAELEQSLAISFAYAVDGPHERRLPPQRLDDSER